jgi:hypothetical protein
VLVAACADGAGSAEFSDVGARLAVETFIETARTALAESAAAEAAIEPERLRAWTRLVRRRLELEADSRSIAVRQLACTLLTAVVGTRSAAFSQIGDGLVVLDGNDGYEFVFWPDSGEYANMTRFLTDLDYEQHLRFDVCERPVQDVAILTDGLQMLALSKAEGKVHAPFFKPMFDSLRATPSGDLLRESLVAFLDSNRVNQRTDDDKTLLLATRRPTTDDAHIDPPEAD